MAQVGSAAAGSRPEDEYAMPAEWEPHAGCWLGWPYRRDVWHSGALPAQRAYAAVATAIARFEPVTVCATTECWEQARTMLPSDVRVVEMGLNDPWFRDQAPIFVRHKQRGDIVGLDWGFDAWGEYCYSDWSLDCLLARKICDLERLPVLDCTSMILEGGSIHVDGQGTLLTTVECLLKQNTIGNLRNPGLDKHEIESTCVRALPASLRVDPWHYQFCVCTRATKPLIASQWFTQAVPASGCSKGALATTRGCPRLGHEWSH